MARILAIDYGKKKTGVAVTDPLQIIVSPLATVPRQMAVESIDSYLHAEHVVKVIIGRPEARNELVNAQLDRFVDELTKRFPDLELEFHDEAYSSVEAKKIILKSGLKQKARRDKALIDQVSATLILQDYLGHLIET